MDSQIVELVGRQFLIGELFSAGLEAANPVRDRGVDLVAYLERGDEPFASVPIQVKASSIRAWGVNRKYSKTQGLIVAHVWNVSNPAELEVYAMTYGEKLVIAEEMGYLSTSSWIDGGAYTTSQPSRKLLALLAPYRMASELWLPAFRRWTDPARKE